MADLIQFDIGSGSRIARAVRVVEGMYPAAKPLVFSASFDSAPRQQPFFRVCTFTASWSIGTEQTVTFKNQTDTPNTVAATNLFFPISQEPAGPVDCAIAKEGTAWYLVDVKLKESSAVFVTSTASVSVATDVDITATLNTSDCTITINKSPVTASITVVQATETGTYLSVDV